ncbi:HAD family hydrolase [Paenibacillus sp. SYP-B4298]|uniref:HAD family hydrolase n=1 Tax=Paenibacillus sp. SYP-B4298 TaxID=2996034 RepID=UPI0022DE77DE|nr:HAD family hydrolase [Paenibacillus sp. SYP-B4298]
MKHDIRLVVCDLDGTVLLPDHQLPEHVISALRAYRQAGGMVTIATGRPALTAASIVQQLNIELPAIYCNGAVIADPDKVWHQAEFAAAPFLPLQQAAAHAGAELLMFGASTVYAFRRSQAIEHYEHKERVVCELIEEQAMLSMERLNKLLLIGPMAVIRKVWEAAGALLHTEYTALQSEDTFLEIVPKEVNKGKALCRLMDILNIEPKHVMAIGNQVNDLELLQEAGIGVAVGNSHPLLMEQADYICRHEYGDGVIEALHQFGCLTERTYQ